MPEKIEDPLDDPLGDLSEGDRLMVEESLALKKQAAAVLGMAELKARIEALWRVAEERRDATYGDEHFVWSGKCIALRDLVRELAVLADYQPPKGKGKRAPAYC